MNTPLSYHAYHLALLQSLYDTLRAQSALLEQVPEESNELFMERFDDSPPDTARLALVFWR